MILYEYLKREVWEKSTTKKSQKKKILKKNLVSNRKYKTTYKDIKKYFNIINKVGV